MNRNRKAAQQVASAASWAAAQPWPDDVHLIFNQHSSTRSTVNVTVYCQTLDAVREVRRIVGPVRKQDVGYGLELVGEVAADLADVEVTINPPSGTCKRVQVGTEKVVRQEPVGEVEYVDVEVEEPVYEWECPGSVLEDESEVVPA